MPTPSSSKIFSTGKEDARRRSFGRAVTRGVACSKAAEGTDERGQKKLEAAVARAVVKTQEVVTEMLREYKESTRGARAAKHEELDAWWSGEQLRRAVRAQAMRGLRALGEERGRERKRLRDAMADAVVGAQAAAAEGG